MADMNQVQANQQLIQQMMKEAEAKRAADLISQGNNAKVPVEINYTSINSGETYKGTFVFRRPSAMDAIKVGTAKSEYLRTNGVRPQWVLTPDGQYPMESMAHVEPRVVALAQSLATCKVLLESAPDWFGDYENMFDYDVLLHLEVRFSEELLSFRKQPEKVPANNSETTGDQETLASAEIVRGESGTENGSGTASDRPAVG